MRQLDLISHSRVDKKKRTHRTRGYLSSIIFHVVLIGALVELSFLYRGQLPLDHQGSTPGAPVISLETMVIVSPPAPPEPPSPIQHSAPTVTSVVAASAPAIAAKPAPEVLPPEPEVLPEPEIGLPVLPGKTTKLVQAMPVKTGAPVHPKASTASSGGGIGHLRPTGAQFVSSYAPGVEGMPHPPYPTEARDRQQTGVVRMLIKFDAAGNVSRADITQSSGVPVLDSATRSFISTNWHSTTYAGKAVSVPVEYTLTSL